MMCWLGFHAWRCYMVDLPKFYRHCVRCNAQSDVVYPWQTVKEGEIQ